MKAQDSQVAKFVKALPNPTPLKTVSWCGFLESFPFRLDFVGMAERVCSLTKGTLPIRSTNKFSFR
jgi:hypothetical protein